MFGVDLPLSNIWRNLEFLISVVLLLSEFASARQSQHDSRSLVFGHFRRSGSNAFSHTDICQTQMNRQNKYLYKIEIELGQDKKTNSPGNSIMCSRNLKKKVTVKGTQSIVYYNKLKKTFCISFFLFPSRRVHLGEHASPFCCWYFVGV